MLNLAHTLQQFVQKAGFGQSGVAATHQYAANLSLFSQVCKRLFGVDHNIIFECFALKEPFSKTPIADRMAILGNEQQDRFTVLVLKSGNAKILGFV